MTDHGCDHCGKVVDRLDFHIMENRPDGQHRYWHERCWYLGRGVNLWALKLQAETDALIQKYREEELPPWPEPTFPRR